MLLNDYAHKQNYEVVREVFCMGTRGSKVKPDGILKTLWGIDVGIWESKDEKDNIEDEIDAKQKKGYPLTNTLFEDSSTAVLFQRGEEILRVNMRDADELDKILKKFISFKNDIVYKFEDAIEKFKSDIPTIIEVLRKRIEESGNKNKNFIAVRNSFLELCKAEINPEFTLADVREMMIQHILTSDIFNKIFDDADFHRHNTIAAELEKLINTLFDYSERRNLLASIEHYYDTINATAAGIADHHEKQKFLKILYENFYKVYNPKAADRLGVVYTPNEIVKFMIESTDYLLHKHFGKTLADKNVEILDPATGTGTFVCDIIEHIPKAQLIDKYKNELHANDVAILPYYIANLNIEFTFKQKMGYYDEFVNICFVDTLDNTGFKKGKGKQTDIFALSSENAERIKRQNAKKISVIIGNPPYNANQKNENENNKNREYEEIDKRIKETFIKASTAQKTKVYDMYSRFYRWAMDRLDDRGIIAFITNRSFIESRTFDGFRRVVQREYDHAYIIDTRSDVRTNPKIAGTTHNVFGIQTGVAIMFLVRTKQKEVQDHNCRIEYFAMEDEWLKEVKLEWLRNNKFENISFTPITPDKNGNWINLAKNDWESLLPIGDKDVKLGKSNKAIFKMFSMGVVTARDEWVYDFNKENLKRKIQFLINRYNSDLKKLKGKSKEEIGNETSKDIKWTRAIKNDLFKGKHYSYNEAAIVSSFYRPYTRHYMYFSKELNEMPSLQVEIYGNDLKEKNICFGFIGNNTVVPFSVLGFNLVNDYNSLSNAANGNKTFPLYHYTSKGEISSNITEWSLQRFADYYKSKKITKENIFHYVYAVLHHPAYRKKYELNLKREFPRIPFYDDFFKWADWGKALIDLHINYETVKPYDLKVIASETKQENKKAKELFTKAEEPELMFARKPKIKVKLKADKQKGIIEIDELTFMSGIPKEAWEYKLGNRSALEWILDQYKEKKPKDPTIAEKFNTYRFADYKDKVIDLLKRVCTVSVETMKIINEMP
jgi:predicted helicase